MLNSVAIKAPDLLVKGGTEGGPSSIRHPERRSGAIGACGRSEIADSRNQLDPNIG